MPFLIGDQALLEEATSEQLFEKIQNLPTAEEIQDQVEYFDKLQQKNARGVLEKGYILISAHNSNNNQVYLAGTDRLYTCISVTFYGMHTKKLAITHIDGGIDATSLGKVLAEFTDEKMIIVRIFGGLDKNAPKTVPEQDHQGSSAATLSVNLAKKIYSYLYEATAFNENITLKIISSNTFEKLNAYKNACIHSNTDMTTTVGFVMNARNGYVLLFQQLHFGNKYLPYITINNNGIFSEPFKKGALNARMHKRWGFLSDELTKRYDNRPGWEAEYFSDLEARSLQGIANIILAKLTGNLEDFILNEEPLRAVVVAWIKMYENNNENNFFTQELFKYTAVQIFSKNYKDETIPYDSSQQADFLINKLLEALPNSGLYEKMSSGVHDSIVQKVIADSTEKDEATQKRLALLSALANVKGTAHLKDELKYFDENNLSNDQNLLQKLKSKPFDVSYNDIIFYWITEKIKNSFRLALFQAEIKISKEYKINNFIDEMMRQFNRAISYYDITSLDLDWFHIEFAFVNRDFEDKLTILIKNKLAKSSYLGFLCCVNLFDEILCVAARNLIEAWLDQAKTPFYSNNIQNNNNKVLIL